MRVWDSRLQRSKELMHHATSSARVKSHLVVKFMSAVKLTMLCEMKMAFLAMR